MWRSLVVVAVCGATLSACGTAGTDQPRDEPKPKQAAVALPTASRTELHTAEGTARDPRHAIPSPKITWKPIPYGKERKREMADYAQRHYGFHDFHLVDPHVIVEHYTANESFDATYNTFASDNPDPELHELPNVCAQFVVDKDGTIYQLVKLYLMCRHTVGLNYTAIGIEHVGTSEPEILGNSRQLRASLKLTRWLRCSKGIRVRDVIGHNESLSSKYHKERVASLRTQTHGDWTHHYMKQYRGKLRDLAGC
ncbi:MAG TPA: peptidoglycan recognition family protein [Thermoleophilaceae bacterium]|nr:peptidoglycan recognition family protein [Thermoleophilaceae bacterium]